MALRLAHVALLAVASGALLLLLSRYGVEDPPHPKLTLYEVSALANIILNTTSHLNLETNHSKPLSTSTRIHNITTALSKKSTTTSTTTKAPNEPKVIWTKEIYDSGHAKPHPELCPSLGENLKLMIFITSAPAHFKARQAIRMTWGHYASRYDVSMAFFIGSAPASTQKVLDQEDLVYGDVVRGNFIDSYSNLTLKTISMLEWADSYCPKARRILKTDDDMFINVPRLLAFIDKRVNATKTIWGRVFKKSKPLRSTNSKYYVTHLQYSGKVYPEFTSGPAYLMTGDVVSPLYARALTQPYVRLEDVYVTGILASQLKIARSHYPEFYNKKVSFHPCVVQRGIAMHMIKYHEQFDLWRKLLDGQSKCAGS